MKKGFQEFNPKINGALPQHVKVFSYKNSILEKLTGLEIGSLVKVKKRARKFTERETYVALFSLAREIETKKTVIPVSNEAYHMMKNCFIVINFVLIENYNITVQNLQQIKKTKHITGDLLSVIERRGLVTVRPVFLDPSKNLKFFPLKRIDEYELCNSNQVLKEENFLLEKDNIDNFLKTEKGLIFKNNFIGYGYHLLSD